MSVNPFKKVQVDVGVHIERENTVVVTARKGIQRQHVLRRQVAHSVLPPGRGRISGAASRLGTRRGLVLMRGGAGAA